MDNLIQRILSINVDLVNIDIKNIMYYIDELYKHYQSVQCYEDETKYVIIKKNNEELFTITIDVNKALEVMTLLIYGNINVLKVEEYFKSLKIKFSRNLYMITQLTP